MASTNFALVSNFKCSTEIGIEIEKAVEEALLEGRTIDIEIQNLPTLSTKEMGDLIAKNLKNRLKK